MTGELQKTVGANLRVIRESLGLSQEKFAETLEVHRTYVGMLERGERNISLQTVESLADRLGVDPLSLLTSTA